MKKEKEIVTMLRRIKFAYQWATGVDLTNADIAKKIGMSPVTVNQWSSANSPLTPGRLAMEAIRRNFGIYLNATIVLPDDEHPNNNNEREPIMKNEENDIRFSALNAQKEMTVNINGKNENALVFFDAEGNFAGMNIKKKKGSFSVADCYTAINGIKALDAASLDAIKEVGAQHKAAVENELKRFPSFVYTAVGGSFEMSVNGVKMSVGNGVGGGFFSVHIVKDERYDYPRALGYRDVVSIDSEAVLAFIAGGKKIEIDPCCFDIAVNRRGNIMIMQRR